VANVRAVVFDLGHTLWDFAPTGASRRYSVMRLYNALHASLGDATPAPALLDKAYTTTIARWIERWNDNSDGLVQEPTEDLVREALATLGLEVGEELLSAATYEILGVESSMPVVEPDTLAAIATLHGRGLALGCVTNTLLLEEGIIDLLQRLGLLRYIEARIASSRGGFRKPHPALFQRALDQLGVAPHEAVFVGDRLVDDVGGAKGIGMRAVLTHQYRQEPLDDAVIAPDAVIQRLAELPDVIERLDAAGKLS
jgi:HAD superfamily hydrolase (TIGR01509 family)